MNLKSVAKGMGFKMNSKPFLTSSFFFLNGLFAGVGLNDFFRITNSPLNDKPLIVGGQQTDFDSDYLIGLGVGGLLILAEWLGGIKYASTLGYGFILGNTWANRAETGHHIGLTHL